MIHRVLLAAALSLIPGVVRAKPPAVDAAFAPKLIIYPAKGAANACGPGCDRWIAVEGRIDQDAASRIRRFLLKVKDTQRPIYFHSPGGVVGQSFLIGRLLRSRKAVARIGRTIVTACGAATQVDDACLKIKTGGGEVEAEIVTRYAMCNSACSYLFLGATTREVAPDAAMAVHNSKLTMIFHGHPSAQQIAAFTERSTVKADRERASFIAAMGISHELTDLVRTVKFESLHILTRPELYRFGIDTRPTVETAWRLEGAARPYVRKIVLAKKDDSQSFRTMEWRLFCENKDRARLMFVREFDQGGAAVNSVIMIAGSEKPVIFGKFPARTGTYEVWSETIASDTMKAVLAASHLQIGEGASMSEGKTSLATFDIDTNGMEAAWTQFLASCPAAPANAKSVIASPGLTFSPAQ
ncbi:hypothetical protein [Bradyrhizobium canariense]|uniref:Uncharacterized protein n=1 Tax=Bradyrhizobium canariense TaxID=255045 RepID=A0A1H1N5S7_9BRAD|nr:hypothetical protein [Bradyrhizobium canariense]SDR94501.1 hypothetical protein SAMN05444158_0500 [Bradyrhizobium canariense]